MCIDSSLDGICKASGDASAARAAARRASPSSPSL